jgi:P pilus assembly chaperone PapD
MKFFSPGRPALPLRRSSARIWGLSLVLLLAVVVDTAEAVSVSPTALYIDSRTRTGVMTLHNPGSLPEEITIGFAFGYPISDANGLVSVQLLNAAPAGEPSAAEWMRVFPRRLVLQPGQRQVIRVMVQPPADLPDGEYWARIIISSRGGQPPIEQTDGNVSLQLNVETVLVMAANYRQGAVSAGVEITGASAEWGEDGVTLELDMNRTGNAAALGRVLVDLLDARGSVVASTYEDIAVYRTMRRRLSLPVPENVAGLLSVRIRIVPEREDLPASSILRFAPVIHTLAVAQ